MNSFFLIKARQSEIVICVLVAQSEVIECLVRCVATSDGEDTNIGAASGSYKHCYCNCLSVCLSLTGSVCQLPICSRCLVGWPEVCSTEAVLFYGLDFSALLRRLEDSPSNGF